MLEGGVICKCKGNCTWGGKLFVKSLVNLL